MVSATIPVSISRLVPVLLWQLYNWLGWPIAHKQDRSFLPASLHCYAHQVLSVISGDLCGGIQTIAGGPPGKVHSISVCEYVPSYHRMKDCYPIPYRHW